MPPIHQHTRRPRRHAQGTLVTGEFVAAAWAKTLPLAGTAIVGDVAIKPLPIATRAARTIIRIAPSCSIPCAASPAAPANP